MIPRIKGLHANKLLSYFPAVGITGPRQCGKTTLARYIQTMIADREVIYLDLENSRDLQKISDPLFFFESHADACIILDEIQERPDLFPLLRSLIDHKY